MPQPPYFDAKHPDQAGSPPEESSSFAPAAFVYVKTPLLRRAGDREMARDEAIDQALRAQGIGSVIGWGDSLGERLPDGSRPAAFHRVDIDVLDLALVRAALHALLPVLGVPPGTEIHYKRASRHLQDVYTSAGWIQEQALS